MNVVSIDVCGFYYYISLYGCYRVLGDISFLSIVYMAGVLCTMVSCSRTRTTS